MYDNELADGAQHLLDALDEFLDNGDILRQLSAADLVTLRKHRAGIAEKLDYYRAVHFMGKRRRPRPVTVPSGPQQGLTMSAVLAAPFAVAGAGAGAGAVAGASTVPVAAAGTGAGASLGGAALAAGYVLLPIAAAILVNALTGGSPHEKATRMLGDSVQALVRELEILDAYLLPMAITGGMVVAMSVADIIKAIDQIVNAALGVLGIAHMPSLINLLKALAKLFPQCVSLMNALEAAVRHVNRSKAGRHRGWRGGNVAKAKQDAQRALGALMSCISRAGSATPVAGER